MWQITFEFEVLIVNQSKWKLQAKWGPCPNSLQDKMQRITFRLMEKEIHVEQISPLIVFSNDPVIIAVMVRDLQLRVFSGNSFPQNVLIGLFQCSFAADNLSIHFHFFPDTWISHVWIFVTRSTGIFSVPFSLPHVYVHAFWDMLLWHFYAFNWDNVNNFLRKVSILNWDCMSVRC